MTHRMLQLNMTQSRVNMLPLRAATSDLTGNALDYSPESTAAGGNDFSFQRNIRAATTVHDALPVADGFITPTYVMEEPEVRLDRHDEHIVRVYDCNHVQFVATYREFNFVGLANLPQGTLAWRAVDGRVSLGGKPATLNGLNTAPSSCSWVACIAASGRVVAATKDQIFWSGVNDNLNFEPSLSTGAGSTSFTHEVGSIVQLVPSPEGFYVLGTTGALHAQCTGDVQFPYQFRPVVGFRGIRQKKHCVVKSAYVSELYAWTGLGLQVIKGLQANDVEPDLSVALYMGNYTILRTTTRDAHSYACGREYRDNFNCDSKNLVAEVITSSTDIRVVNVDERHVTVSYGGDAVGEYSQCYVIDKMLGRSAILNVVHTDFFLGLKHAAYGRLYEAKFDCTARGYRPLGKYYVHNLTDMRGRVMTASRLHMTGQYCHTDYYNASKAPTGEHGLQSVQTLQGVDVKGSHYDPSGLSLTFASVQEVQYAGRLRQYNLSLLIPFMGHMSGLSLDI